MKSIKNVVKSLIILGFLASCSQKHNIEGYISGIGNDTIYVECISLYSFDADEIYDTINSKDGKFSYSLPSDEPMLVALTPKKGELIRLDKTSYRTEATSILLFVKPSDRIRVNGILEEFYLEYIAKGSQINESHSKLRVEYKYSLIEETKIELALDTLIYNRGDRNEIQALFEKRREQTEKARKLMYDFVLNNWDCDLSAYYLVRQPLDTVGKYVTFLNSNVREGIFENILNEQLNRFEKYNKVREAELKIKPGERAPEFILTSLDNSEYSFLAMNEKYTILYFWGSWCGPCISGLPKMRDYFTRYNDYFDVIAIACRDKEESWREAVKKYEITSWINLINEQDIDGDVSVTYAVQSYPTKIVIKPDGLIDGIFSGEGEDFYKSLDGLTKK